MRACASALGAARRGLAAITMSDGPSEEEAYGDAFNSRRNGPVVVAEEAYGDDWDPRRGGPVLSAEEEYSFSFGADDEMEDIPLFSESFQGDEVDDQLEQLEKQARKRAAKARHHWSLLRKGLKVALRVEYQALGIDPKEEPATRFARIVK
jgi:hypothetical protein